MRGVGGPWIDPGKWGVLDGVAHIGVSAPRDVWFKTAERGPFGVSGGLNASECVVLSASVGAAGLTVAMTPDEARALAQRLIAQADEGSQHG